ncbi:hypothetical protein NBRC111894_3756 [Sporolactobacillus inulinus]|jgi:hypothetical protein|uniref:Uncharacterized protein n=1 Tax=Sporolactobacillus inulinus TaxID=2078 RepID=A0A4Y1ZGA0_9BACL|nr:hypothetical protein NBRC111894_3756 [Sporolactobacillus inulinus]
MRKEMEEPAQRVVANLDVVDKAKQYEVFNRDTESAGRKSGNH